MIEAREFIEAARERDFRWYAGVPCSYLTPFINYVLQDLNLRYLSMTNEGDAVALMAGIALSADQGRPRRGVSMMQNSGLGNAVSPLTSLTWTFRLPQLLIVTWRGQPGVPDEPQHELMGAITPTMLDTMQIPWEFFPTVGSQLGDVLDRATEHMDRSGRPFALLMQKGSVAEYPLAPGAGALRAPREGARVSNGAGLRAQATDRPSRREILRAVIASSPLHSTAVLASTGFCGRELYALEDRPNQLYMVGSMGCVALLALGLALARPDLRVIAVDGDGAALMRMGAFATIGAYAPANLWHLLLDNGIHDSTGGQTTVSSLVDFAQIAAACGYADALDARNPEQVSGWLDQPLRVGPKFARVMIGGSTPRDLPRPTVAPADVAQRFMRHLHPGGRVN
jgi:phosphonopyruvate decarboxylase